MVEVGRETHLPTLAVLLGNDLPDSTSMERIKRDGNLSRESAPPDMKIVVGETTYSLHKTVLASKCGLIRKLISEAEVSNGGHSSVVFLEVPDVPGGAEALELAVSFCYGEDIEMRTENIATLRCAAEHLEMWEEYSGGNLISRTEYYLNNVALTTLSGAITVLRCCCCSESLLQVLPLAEKVGMVDRCVDVIARKASTEENWWVEELTTIRIDVFQRVFIAMKARRLKPHALVMLLMLYAQKSLQSLQLFGRGRKRLDARTEHGKRVVLETIVRLLSGREVERATPVSFLAMLLRAAMYLDTTVACRIDLERRVGLQLGQATLDDLLIPSFSIVAGDTVFDVDLMQRILVNYLDCHEVVSSPIEMGRRVGRVVELYLAEIACDSNLTPSRFVELAELLPQKARTGDTDDAIYRAVDIYLKVHPTTDETERKKICGLMECQRLSREARVHAAHNKRLPVEFAVQVLYYEQQQQQRPKNNGGCSGGGGSSASLALLTPRPHGSSEVSQLRRENDELKLELMRMKMKLREEDKGADVVVLTPTVSADKPPLHRKSLLNSVSRTLGRLNPFQRSSDAKEMSTRPSKDRRHSIS